MSLYTKYRPKTFEDFIGLEAEANTIKGLLKKKDAPRVYLFSGPAGCGKTSMARVIASELGTSDIRELNSADTRGIDTAREIIESCMYISTIPTVYILDEVHQTSKDFQNAMLKLLEDVPPNVWFILCSSEPNKIIAAVKSRCTEIKFKALSVRDTMRLCKRVAKEEGASISVDVLEVIAERSNGSPRTALVLLEESIAGGTQALDILGDSMIDSTTLDLCRALLARGNWREVVARLETTEWESIRYAVLGYMASVLLKSNQKQAAVVIDSFKEPFYNSGKAGFLLACYKSLL